MLAPKINTHVQDALNRLLQQYKGQPQLAGLITAFVQQFQDLENAFFSLDQGRQLSHAVGAQLDGLGELAGITRNGLSDVEFLVFILGTIAENNSDTTIPAILNVASIIFEPIILTLKEMYPAEVGIGIGGSAIGLASGQTVQGGQFPSGSTIEQIITQPVIHLGHITNGSSVVTALNTSLLAPGMLVTGATFTNVAAIISIDSPTQVTLTNLATSATGSYALTFSAVISMSQPANADSTASLFDVLDQNGNVENVFTGNTRQGAPGITDFQVQLSDALKLKIGSILQNSLGASITLGFLTFFDAANSFAFDGTGPAAGGAAGFGDLNDPTVGGQFASLIFGTLPE